MVFDSRIVLFLVYFNRDRDFFECHEVMEELWLDQGSDPLYKGLLQVAVGMFHFRAGNKVGAYKMLRSAVDKLKDYPEDHIGLNLGKICRECLSLADELAPDQPSLPPYREIDIEITDAALKEAVATASRDIEPNIPLQITRQRGPKHELRKSGLRSEMKDQKKG